ncbi:cobalt ABC transporter permease [Oenococcus oeni]|nr:energy-coupling factor transporter transmembrane component T [Oenococcus oeni]KGH96562.1 cobalt ABC transporter permease [Oenococcus oeni IOEB_1491]KGI04672.1 cobalt ABC transporter permease [Oenococcus oeni S19]OIK87149.1 cobalt ABC transporter permease [Oenococcus oeni]OIL73575.1 cobalt ABC transporter permease [Oenococcus oeni]OIM05659.1 cobalt ABC transporter permease [Oenococcus oeni]
MIFGRYVSGDSFIHKLDPRDKLISATLIIIISFLANEPLSALILGLICLLILLVSKIKLLFFFRGIRFFLIMIAFTAILQLLFANNGEELFSVGPIRITSFGAKIASLTSFRFSLAIIIATLFTLTTSMIQISDAVGYLIRPLKIFKLPVDDIVLTLSIALRFIPTMLQEISTISDAQKARGSSLNSRSIAKKIKAIVPILMPLFIASVRRAEDLATAMIMRGYSDGKNRTKFRIMKWKNRDTLIILFLLFLLIFFGITKK